MSAKVRTHEIPGICSETRYTLWPNDLLPTIRSKVLTALTLGYVVGRPQGSVTHRVLTVLTKGLSQRFARDVMMPINGMTTVFGDKLEPQTDLVYPHGALHRVPRELVDLRKELVIRHKIMQANRSGGKEKTFSVSTRRLFVPDLDSDSCDTRGRFHMIRPDDPRMLAFVAKLHEAMPEQYRRDLKLMHDIVINGEAVDYTVTHVATRNRK